MTSSTRGGRGGGRIGGGGPFGIPNTDFEPVPKERRSLPLPEPQRVRAHPRAHDPHGMNRLPEEPEPMNPAWAFAILAHEVAKDTDFEVDWPSIFAWAAHLEEPVVPPEDVAKN